MTWTRKFEHIGARSFDEVLSLWARRSPIGIELGQHRLAEHIDNLTNGNLPVDGSAIIGPIEARSLISELYCGGSKATNLNLHAQLLSSTHSFTNGSIHSFNSLIQFMMAIISIFGVFIIRLGGKYFVVDVFPWLGHPNDARSFRKSYGDNWWRYARILSDSKEIIEQKEIVALFQRCLRITTGVGWPEILIKQLIHCESRWLNRPRNNILYNFTGWTETQDLLGGLDVEFPILLRSAARTIFDPDEQTAFGSLPQSLLLGSMFLRIWREFRGVVAMDLNGLPAPELPEIVDAGLIEQFEAILAEELASAAQA